MSAPVFVDSNVFLYARDPTEPLKQSRAGEWIAHLWHTGLGRTSTQVLSEYYVNVSRKFKVPAEKAWEDVSALLAWNPQTIDGELMARAREVERRYRLSWWDSMVAAAAQLQGCAVLLTEDFQDGMRFDEVTVQSPFAHGVREPEAAYAAVPVAASLHRPRGRPRKSALA